MKTKFGIFAVILLMTIVGCKKETKVDNPWMAKITTNKYDNISSIFKEINPVSLNTAIETKNESYIRSSVNDLANNIASYFFDKYKIDLRNDFVDNPEGIVTLGLFYAAKEKNAALANTQSLGISPLHVEEDFWCFLEVVGAVIGIGEAKNIWRSIMAGATDDTIIAAVRLVGRRVAGIFTVGIMIAGAGHCLGFW